MQEYNYNKLKGLIREYFTTQKNFADALNISLTTLNSRLKSETFFNQKEIETASKLLHLKTIEDVNSVFFVQK